MDQDREQRIRERAHAIWESEGRPEGRHEEHWRQATGSVGREESHPDYIDPTLDSMQSGTPGAGFNTRAGGFGGGEGVTHDLPDAAATEVQSDSQS